MSAVDTEAAAVWERLLDRWERQEGSLRVQARNAPCRTAADRGVIVGLHAQADAIGACRTELAMTLAEMVGRRVAAHGKAVSK